MPDHKLHIRSEEIQEIIGQIPPWVIRWGITVMLSVLLVCVFCSFYIKFPDVLHADVIISSKDQPYRVSWYKNGPQMYNVYVKEGQQVKAGDTLFVEQDLVNHTITPIISPVAGKIILFKGTEDNARKETIIVYPPITSYQTNLYLDPKGFGNSQIEQKVLIKLDAYPEEVFGSLEGQITSILSVPINDKYRVEVDLLNGLITTENKHIPNQHNLSGKAEIILEDKNIFSRIFGSIF
jgi:hypothetical protein